MKKRNSRIGKLELKKSTISQFEKGKVSGGTQQQNFPTLFDLSCVDAKCKQLQTLSVITC